MNVNTEIEKLQETVASFDDIVRRTEHLLASMKAEKLRTVARLRALELHRDLTVDDVYQRLVESPDDLDVWEHDQSQTDDVLIYRVQS